MAFGAGSGWRLETFRSGSGRPMFHVKPTHPMFHVKPDSSPNRAQRRERLQAQGFRAGAGIDADRFDLRDLQQAL